MEVALRSPQERGFAKRNIIYIAIISVLCMFGVENKPALIASIVVFIFAVFFSSNEDRFCWSLFLIPNIRLYDGLGSTSFVNILICLPFLFYIPRKLITRQTCLSGAPIFMAFCMFMIEYLHMASLRISIYPLYGWILGFLWCCYVTLDESIKIDKEDSTYALVLGIICSAAIYMVNNPWFTSDMIDKIVAGHRFEAYANDPNYYSLYICLSLAAIVIKKHLKFIDYVLIVILLAIEFMTASKMGFFLMAILVFYLIVGGKNNMNKYVRNFFIISLGSCIIYVLRDHIGQFLDNLFRRSGGKGMSISSFTTGRSDILIDYLELLQKDFSTLMFGKGFNYLIYTWRLVPHDAHNTYLDFILAWGITGTVVLFGIIAYWFRRYKEKLCAKRYTGVSKLPFFVLMLTFFALTCFSAAMFFFVISFCLLQLEPVKEDSSIENERDVVKYE